MSRTTASLRSALNDLLNDANLVGYYPLNNDYIDYSSSSKSLITKTGSPTFTAGKFPGQALSLGASNSNTSAYNNQNLGIDGGNITIAAWVKLLTEIGSGVYTFFGQFSATSKVQYGIHYQYNSGTRRISFARDPVGISGGYRYHNVDLGTDNWYHLALTYDGSDMIGYFNGTAETQLATSGNGNTGATSHVAVGTGIWNAGTDSWASAIISDFCIFSRVLNQSEIDALQIGKVSKSRSTASARSVASARSAA